MNLMFFKVNEADGDILKKKFLFSPSIITLPSPSIVRFLFIRIFVLESPLYVPSFMIIFELSYELEIAGFSEE